MEHSPDLRRYPAVTQGVRVLAGVNALYQGGVGLLSLFAPAMADQIYRLAAPQDNSTLAITRILGGMMAANAVGLGWFACVPVGNPVLAPLLLTGAISGTVAAVLPCIVGELRWQQMIGSIVFQALLGFGLAAHLSQRRTEESLQS